MAADEKKDAGGKLITEKKRFNYIGFDVFPGTPKDLFKSEAEKEKYENSVKAKRDKGDTLREECTLLEPRVSNLDRIVLSIASFIILVSLFMPWFSAYNEIIEDTAVVEEPSSVALVDSMPVDSMLMDSALLAATGETVADEAGVEEAIDESSDDEEEDIDAMATDFSDDVGSEEILHGYVAKKKIHKEYANLSGIGVFGSLGSVGSYLFSSGIILIITAILLILYVLMSVLVPFYNIYGLYGLKGNDDQKALILKKMLRLNWIPLLLLILTFVLSFIGSEYGFTDPKAVFTSIGLSYGPGVFLGSLSIGILVSLSGFILSALKGMEI